MYVEINAPAAKTPKQIDAASQHCLYGAYFWDGVTACSGRTSCPFRCKTRNIGSRPYMAKEIQGPMEPTRVATTHMMNAGASGPISHMRRSDGMRPDRPVLIDSLWGSYIDVRGQSSRGTHPPNHAEF